MDTNTYPDIKTYNTSAFVKGHYKNLHQKIYSKELKYFCSFSGYLHRDIESKLRWLAFPWATAVSLPFLLLFPRLNWKIRRQARRRLLIVRDLLFLTVPHTRQTKPCARRRNWRNAWFSTVINYRKYAGSVWRTGDHLPKVDAFGENVILFH